MITRSIARMFGRADEAIAGADADKIQTAIEAKSQLGEDFFGGWTEADVDLFHRHARPTAPTPGKITDFLGVVTDNALHPWATHLFGKSTTTIPIPDDGLRAEAIEYFAVLQCIESSPGPSFTMVKLGASYAPWLTAAAVVALRSGRKNLTLTAVEASRLHFDLIAPHLAANGIGASDHSLKLFHGAIAKERGIMRFPVAENAGDNGGQVVAEGQSSTFVRPMAAYEEVTAFTLADVLPEKTVDLLHVDIQGAEADVLISNPDLLDNRVRTLFVGTHSRLIEGRLLEFFHAQGWQLVRERPAKFAYRSDEPNVVGWTTRDGGQYWVNPRI
jgi:FkbM family methyltransferase